MRHKLLCTAFLALFSAFFAQNSFAQNLFTVKFPDDRTIIACDGTAPLEWPVVSANQCSVAVGISHSDEVFVLTPDACKKIVRRWRLLYWCNFDPTWAPTQILNPTNTDTGPTVNGTVANRGYLEYEQIIKIVDSGDPVISSKCEDLVFCDWSPNDPTKFSMNGHDRCEGPVGELSVKAWDDCSKSNLLFKYLLFIDSDSNGTLDQTIVSEQAGAFPITVTTQNDTATAKIALPTGYELPYGRHKIKWVVRDGCGNETACGQFFDIFDCKKPTPICQPLSSVLMQPSGMLSISLDHFLVYATDNCTPDDDLLLGIRIAGAGAGFPTEKSINLTCAHVGMVGVEVWAKDAAGNADFCLTHLVLESHPNCPPANFPIFGSVTLPDGEGLEAATISLAPLSMTAKTAANGQFLIQNVPPATAFSLTAALDEPLKKGLTAADAQRLKDHLIGISPFSSPFQFLAADLDGSKTVDWADYQLLRQAASGLLTDLPDGKKSWRFLDAKTQFADPSNPFSSAMPSAISGNGPMLGACSFRAFKMGDLVAATDSVAPTNPTQVVDYQSVASLSVAPNPFSERLVLTFENEKSEQLRVVVSDVFGRTWHVSERHFEAGKNEWLFEKEAAAWPSGSIFFVQIEDEKGARATVRAMKN